jgi:hypothetical protein
VRIVDETPSACFREFSVEQEIAVAVHEPQGWPIARKLGQGAGDGIVEGITEVVIPGPILE